MKYIFSLLFIVIISSGTSAVSGADLAELCKSNQYVVIDSEARTLSNLFGLLGSDATKVCGHKDVDFEVRIGSTYAVGGKIAQQRESERLKREFSEFFRRHQHKVFPIVFDNDGKYEIVGTSFVYGNVVLTDLHVVHKITDRELFIKADNKYLKITGYLPSRRGARNSISYYQDFCVLEIEGQRPPQVELPEAPIIDPLDKFLYVELSYPRGVNSISVPNALYDTVSQVLSDDDNLLILNNGGQDFLSSGGLVMQAKTEEIVGMDICIDNANSVRAIHLSLLQPEIVAATQQPVLPSLEDIDYSFTYLKECRPIGGRRSGD